MRLEQENNISYLVIEGAETGADKDECCDIEYNMIKNNTIKGLLSMQQRIIDGKDIYYYDITAKQQMSKLYSYAQLGPEDVLMICESISSMVCNINMYMLNLEKVILEPEYMYVDVSAKEVEFVYCPCRKQTDEGDFDSSIRKLFEYILEHFDHSVEKEELMTMYMMYQKVIQKEYNLEKLHELVKECRAESKNAGETKSEIIEETAGVGELQTQENDNDKIVIQAVPAENIDDEVEVENEKLLKFQKWIKVAGIVMVILGALKLLLPGLIPLPVNITASAVIVVLGVVVFVGAGMVPKHCFIKVQPRRCRQKYEMPYETCKDNHTILLSDYIKGAGNTSVKLRLVAKDGQEMLEVNRFPCLIGSMKERCDKVISEKLISRLHCCIADCSEGYYIEDMNSTNGTFVNGERLTPNNRHILNDGDEVRLATYVYEVEIR